MFYVLTLNMYCIKNSNYWLGGFVAIVNLTVDKLTIFIRLKLKTYRCHYIELNIFEYSSLNLKILILNIMSQYFKILLLCKNIPYLLFNITISMHIHTHHIFIV